MKQAVILAGGKGTRLSERLGSLPKPLIDICGKSLFERQIELLKRHGFTHVLVLVNYGAQHIKEFCSSRNNWDIQIECVNDGEPRGTAGATLAVLPRLEETFLVMYGDTMLEVDLTRFELYHNSQADKSVTMFLHPNDHPHDSDLVELDSAGRITAFHPYPHDPARYYPNLVNAALYFVRRAALEPWRHAKRPLDFAKDIFPAMLRRGHVLGGYKSPEYIKDCGTPARLDNVCADLASGRIQRASLTVAQPSVFLDRDGTIIRSIDFLSRHEQLELLPGVANAIKRLNQSDYRTVIVTNQPVLARGGCSAANLAQIHNKMETLLGREGAYIDRIYYCPHHPDRGFPGEVAELKGDCNCRKPRTGMIELAKKELNVDTSRSWLVGDTSVDIMTARRAGLRSILVETGDAGNDRHHWVTPDFVVPDLPSAVRFILDDYPRLLHTCETLQGGIDQSGIVLIGGLSRSGKSNFASCMKNSLNLIGRQSVVLSIDRWLRDGDARLPGVLGRYALDEIRTLLPQLASRSRPIELRLPTYDKIARKRVNATEACLIDVTDIVIFEGTAALALLDVIPNRAASALFIHIDEEERHRRVLREYELRGLSALEAEKVYQSRQKDETPVVLATKDLATHCVKLELDCVITQ